MPAFAPRCTLSPGEGGQEQQQLSLVSPRRGVPSDPECRNAGEAKAESPPPPFVLSCLLGCQAPAWAAKDDPGQAAQKQSFGIERLPQIIKNVHNSTARKSGQKTDARSKARPPCAPMSARLHDSLARHGPCAREALASAATTLGSATEIPAFCLWMQCRLTPPPQTKPLLTFWCHAVAFGVDTGLAWQGVLGWLLCCAEHKKSSPQKQRHACFFPRAPCRGGRGTGPSKPSQRLSPRPPPRIATAEMPCVEPTTALHFRSETFSMFASSSMTNTGFFSWDPLLLDPSFVLFARLSSSECRLGAPTNSLGIYELEEKACLLPSVS